jgi:ubiquinone/menaquinone biosynthesis C-methylase UbiE
MKENINREIYDKNYSNENYRIDKVLFPYDKNIINIRFSLIEKWGFDKDVLDLCCGSGSYLIPVLNQVKTAVGVDFSSNSLSEFKNNLQGANPENLILIQSDAQQMPIKDNSVDFIYSYSALYTIPNVASVIFEVSRLLRPGGYASLELGNFYSINTPVCMVHHKKRGWAKPYFIPVPKMYQYFHDMGLEVIEHRAFQFLNTIGTPIELIYLFPFSNPFWKYILGIEIRGRILDEWISSSWLFRNLSFRHFFVVRKSVKDMDKNNLDDEYLFKMN